MPDVEAALISLPTETNSGHGHEDPLQHVRGLLWPSSRCVGSTIQTKVTINSYKGLLKLHGRL